MATTTKTLYYIKWYENQVSSEEVRDNISKRKI